jgi:hypothetical protein
LIDSGEFSAHKGRLKNAQRRRKGLKEKNSFPHVNVADYAVWIKKLLETRWRLNLDGCLTLDRIEEPDVTYENFKELLSLGVKPVPIFHARASEKYLRLYLRNMSETRFGPQIAYGVKETDKEYEDYCIKEYFGMVDGILGKGMRFKVKTHLLGAMRLGIYKYPFFSCDSRTWDYYGSRDDSCKLLVPRLLKGAYHLARCEDGDPLSLYRFDLPPMQIATTPEELKQGSLEWDATWNYLRLLGEDLEEVIGDTERIDLLNLRYFMELNRWRYVGRLGVMRFYFAGQGDFNTNPVKERRLMNFVRKWSDGTKANVGRLISYGTSRHYFGVTRKTSGKDNALDPEYAQAMTHAATRAWGEEAETALQRRRSERAKKDGI